MVDILKFYKLTKYEISNRLETLESNINKLEDRIKQLENKK